MDERAHELAAIIVNYSLKITEQDSFLVQGEDEFEGFAKLLGDLAEKKGAKVTYDLFNLAERKKLIEENDMDALKAECDRICALAKQATARAMIDADSVPNFLESVDPDKVAAYVKHVRNPFLDIVTGNGKEYPGIKWSLVAYPTEAAAKIAGMSFEDYADFVYNATNLDWSQEAAKMKKYKDIFDNAKDVHIQVPGLTDFHISLEGRGGEICDGKYNVPDGEFFYGPVENSANGYIYFRYPITYNGNTVKGIRLVFEKGKIVDFSCEENEEFFTSIMNLDGARFLGEIGIGCNTGIQQYTNSILFDEKMGGTIHIAIGDSYKQSLDAGGGKNVSDVHWDLTCELRKINGNPGGSITVDGKLVQQDGKWLV